ncbi:MAG: glycoside hydrolase family 127 protein [Planctomycetes bacterium]|nr:glycoside hydrolase family 127 protein [Planctomycetota bacterium]
MRNATILSIPLVCLCASWAYPLEQLPTAGYPLKAVPINKVKLEDDFWSPWLKTHVDVTIPHVLQQLEVAGWRNGLALVRALEGAGYCLRMGPNPNLERRVDEIVSSVVIAGYSETNRFFAFPEASVAYYWATGKDAWLKISEKSALLDKQEYFDDKGQPIKEPPGHGGTEFGLCRLYQGTGKGIYLDLAKRFMDARGMPATGQRTWPKFAAQHRPVAELCEPGGHAGSFGWFASSLVDVGALTGDPKYGEAAKRIWQNLVDTRVCITGGCGAVSRWEGFGEPYAIGRGGYNETWPPRDRCSTTIACFC